MIAIDVIMNRADGNPSSYNDVSDILNNNYIELIEFFNSCVADGLVLNTMIPFPPYSQSDVPELTTTTRYYAINTIKATEFQERFMSITAPFSIKQFWMANGFVIQSFTQTQIMFEDEPADQLLDLVDVNDNLLWGVLYPYYENL
jgi:hypothetical protein